MLEHVGNKSATDHRVSLGLVCPASLQFVVWLAACASKVQGSAASSPQRRSDHLESARSNSSTRFLSGKSSKCTMWRSCLGSLENINYPNLLKDAKRCQKHLHVNSCPSLHHIHTQHIFPSSSSSVRRAMAPHVPQKEGPHLEEADLRHIPGHPAQAPRSYQWWARIHPTSCHFQVEEHMGFGPSQGKQR